MAYSFVKLRHDDGSWENFESDWRGQCEALGEDFDSYAGPTFEVLEDVLEGKHNKTAVFALKEEDKHILICHVNCAQIPNYVGAVLRTRFITFCPEYDLTDVYKAGYASALVELLFSVIKLGLNGDEFSSRHVKFHLRSPEDIKIFSAIGHGLSEHDFFESVATRGQWLYLSRK